MTIQEILERLVTARKATGLSLSQVAHLTGQSRPALECIESGAMPLDIDLYLKLCDLYGVSEIWVLTGVAPYFDPASAAEAATRNGLSPAEMGDFLEWLAMLKGLEP